MNSFIDVTASEYIRYNANAAGYDSSDCVKRALSLAFDVPYNDMAKELISTMKKNRRHNWNIPSVYNKVIDRHGAKPSVRVETPMLLSEFADDVGSSGTWLVTTGGKVNNPNHIVCVIDGKIYDSWDSSNQYVYLYQEVINNGRKDFTEIDIKDYIPEIEENVHNVIDSLLPKYNWSQYIIKCDADTVARNSNKYQLKIVVHLVVGNRPYISGNIPYSFDFSIVFTPSTTDEEAHKIIKSTVKTRLYDRFYSINQKELKKQEASESGGDGRRPSGLDPRERRFWNTLPGKVQGIVQSITIRDPGQYSDSYSVAVTPLWGEKTYNNANHIWLEAYDAYEMRELLEEYMKNGTRHLDY